MMPFILSTVEGACEGLPVISPIFGESDGLPVGLPVGLIAVGEYVGTPLAGGKSVGPFVGLTVGKKLLWVVLVGPKVSGKSNETRQANIKACKFCNLH